MHSYFHLCIMVHSMEKVIFYLEEQWYKSCLAEAAQAVRSCGQYGFKADLMVIEAGEEIPEPEYSALYLADSKRLLQMLSDRGAGFPGQNMAETASYSLDHTGNRALYRARIRDRGSGGHIRAL